jgi:hypothetical protein
MRVGGNIRENILMVVGMEGNIRENIYKGGGWRVGENIRENGIILEKTYRRVGLVSNIRENIIHTYEGGGGE